MNPTGALQYILITAFDIYIMIVLARFILQLVRADFYNPVSQFIVKATSPILIPLRRIIPGFGGLDIASIVLMVTLVMLKIAIFFVLNGYPFNPLIFSIICLKSLANSVVIFFMFCIFIGVLLSWIGQGSYNPFADILNQMTEPVMAPARKLLPPMGGLDFSPMLVLLLLGAVRIFFGLEGTP